MSWKFFTAQGQQKTFDYGSALASLGAMVPLYDVTLGAAAANVDIQNISQNYAHLRLVVHGRSDAVASAVYLYIRLNNDSGSNYDVQRLYGIAASAGADESFAATSLNAGNIPASSSTSNVFGIAVYDIPSYANTSYNKAIHMANSHKGSTSTGGLAHILGSGFWRSSSAINRITVYASSGNLIAGTRVTLYGLGVVAPPSPGSILPVAYGTSLPASPVDGQEAILVDSTTNPSYQWRFRYNGSSTSSYKWEFVGGSPSVGMDTANTYTYSSAGSWVDPTGTLTSAPSFTVPRAGDYLIRIVINGLDAAGGGTHDLHIGLYNNTSRFTFNVGTSVGNNAYVALVSEGKSTCAASDVLGYRVQSGVNTIKFSYATFSVVPIRVS